MRMTYDGVELSDRFHVLVTEPQMLVASVSSEKVSGRDGVLVTGTKMDTKKINATLVSQSTDGDGMTRDREWLAALLAGGGVRRLVMPDGLGYDVVVSGTAKVTERTTGMAVAVVFEATDPIGYGVEHYVTVEAGEPAAFTVGGNMPTRVSVRGMVQTQSSDPYLRVTFDGSDTMAVPVASGASRPVMIDGDEKAVMVGGSATILTLSSDWVELGQGRHEVSVNYGPCAVSWVERWVR